MGRGRKGESYHAALIGRGEMLKEEQCHPLDCQPLVTILNSTSLGRGWTTASLWKGRGSLRCSSSWVVFLWKSFPPMKGSVLESHFFGLNVDLYYKAESLLTEKKSNSPFLTLSCM